MLLSAPNQRVQDSQISQTEIASQIPPHMIVAPPNSSANMRASERSAERAIVSLKMSYGT